MYLGWYDGTKKKAARLKVTAAIERYTEKFGEPPAVCLTSPIDAAELEADRNAPSLPVRAVSYLPRWTYYVGTEDDPASDLAA